MCWAGGVVNRWAVCGYVSDDNVVSKHYCYYLLNHLSNKNKFRKKQWVSFYASQMINQDNLHQCYM